MLGTLAERLRQSAMVGYLVAGAIVGPGGFGWVRQEQTVQMLAELGVALLLFTVGLEFSIRKLLTLGKVALVGGTAQVLVTTSLVAGVVLVLGRSFTTAVCVGLIVAMSSTACILRLLSDRMSIDSPWGRSAVGILLLQDASVLPATLLVAALAGGGGMGAVLLGLGKTLLVGGAMVAGFYLLFNLLIPRVLHLQRFTPNRELPALLTAIAAMASAFIAHELGISPAIGAFIAGVLLAESAYSVQIRADILPLKTIMLTLFFGAVGMLCDLQWAWTHLASVVSLAFLVLVGKSVIIALVLRLLGVALPVAVASGICLAEIGEFGFVLAQLAHGTLLDDDLFKLLLTTTVLTLLLSPQLVTMASGVSRWLPSRAAPTAVLPYETVASRVHFDKVAVNAKNATRGATGDAIGGATGVTKGATGVTESAMGATAGAAGATRSSTEPERPILIVGFGPAGQGVAEGLMGICPQRIRVIDMSHRSESRARDYGLKFFVGDAQRLEVLEHAGAGQAEVIVVTLPDPSVARQIVQLCRYLRPDARIYARSRYHVSTPDLYAAGADVVVDEEFEMGQRLATHVVSGLSEVE